MEKDVIEANIVLLRCQKDKQTFGVRVQKMDDDDWYRTWAFKIKPGQAESEGYDKTVIQGHLRRTEEYPGCPHCGTHALVHCGYCNKLSCYNGEESLECPWCGHLMSGFTKNYEKIEIDSDKF